MTRICYVTKFLLIYFSFLPNVFSFSDKNLIQRGFLPLVNYLPNQYEAMSQNWAVIQDKRGLMYFGNNEGVLEFDGVEWRTIPVTNETNVRALAIDDLGIIYVGANNEFGRLIPDSTGTLQYVSLLNELPDKEFNFGDVWKIYSTGDEGIFFQSTNTIFQYKKNAFKTWKSATGFHLMFKVNEKIIVREKNTGLKIFLNHDFHILDDNPVFKSEPVYSILPYTSGSLLVYIKEKGFFKYYIPAFFSSGPNIQWQNQKKVLTPLKTAADTYVKDYPVYDGIEFNAGNFSFATLGGGIFFMDSSGAVTRIFNKNSGLYELTIYHQFRDKYQDLWLATANGISRIVISSYLTYFDRRCNLNGTIESLCIFNDELFVATGLGLFFLNLKPEHNDSKVNNFAPDTLFRFDKVDAINSPAWHLLNVNTNGEQFLLVATDKGIFTVDKNLKTKKIWNGSAFFLHSSLAVPDRIYFISEEGVGYFKISSKAKPYFQFIFKEPGSAFQIYESADKHLWISTFNDGVYKLRNTITDTSSAYSFEQFNSYQSLPEGPVYLCSFKGKTLFGTTRGIYKYQEQSKNFTPDTSYGLSLADGSFAIHRIYVDLSGDLWLIIISNLEKKKINVVYVKLINNKFYSQIIPLLGTSSEIIHAVLAESKQKMWFGGPEGLFHFHSAHFQNSQASFNTLIRKVYSTDNIKIFGGTFYEPSGRILSYQPSAWKITLPSAQNSFNFEFASNYYSDLKSVFYSYFLEGFDKKWSLWKNDIKTTYTNLPPGTYCFRAKARNAVQTTGREASLIFIITPPFYKSWWFYFMQILFIFLLILFGFLFSRYSAKTHRIAQLLITLAIIIIFEYIQNYIEGNFENVLGGITFFKVLLNVLLVIILIPVEKLVSKITKLWYR